MTISIYNLNGREVTVGNNRSLAVNSITYLHLALGFVFIESHVWNKSDHKILKRMCYKLLSSFQQGLTIHSPSFADRLWGPCSIKKKQIWNSNFIDLR
jgi:hypothetical protein